jgi:hypothetical protein
VTLTISSTIASMRCVPSKVMHRVALSCFLPLLASCCCRRHHHHQIRVGPPLSLCSSFPLHLALTRPSGPAQLCPGCSWPRTAKTSTEKRSCCSTKLHCQQGPYLSGTASQREKGFQRTWQLASRSAPIRPYARAPLIPRLRTLPVADILAVCVCARLACVVLVASWSSELRRLRSTIFSTKGSKHGVCELTTEVVFDFGRKTT